MSISTSTLVNTYQYTYGAGNTPNRKVEFHADGIKVWGVVQGKTKGSWQKIGDVNESNMTLEGASTTEKMQIMIRARQTFTNPDYPPDKNFDQLPYDKRIQVLKSLQPDGSYRIEIINNIGSNPYFEKVERLNFFNPS